MAHKSKNITLPDEFDTIARQIVQHYGDSMKAMEISPYDDSGLNPEAIIEFLLRDAQARINEEEELEANFRQSWHEAMTGQTRPVQALLDELNAD